MEKMVTLRVPAAEGGADTTVDVQVPIAIANMSNLVKEMIKDDDSDDAVITIPLPGVTPETLAKVIEWCTHHIDNPMPKIASPLVSADMKVVLAESPWD